MKIIKDKKVLLKIFSGFIAVVLWFAITYTEDPVVSQHITNINAVFSGEAQLRERGLMLVNKDELPVLSAVIRGNRSKVIASLGVVSANIDVSHIQDVGTHEAPVSYNYSQNAVTLTKTKVSAVSVVAEKILSRDVPVKVEADVNGRDTEHLVSVKSNTESLTIRGAQSTVQKIAYAKAVIDASEITVDGEMNYVYKLYDENDNVLNEKNIISKSQSTVSVTGTVYKRATLPVNVMLSDSLKKNYTLKVKKQSVDSLTVGIHDDFSITELQAVLDSNITKEHSPVTIDIQIPDGVYCPLDDLSITVEYELLPKTSHEVEVLVVPENIPEGMEVEINPEKIKVTMKCAEKDAVASKISAVIDASELDETEKNITVNVAAVENIDIIGEYAVTAKLH